MPEDRRPLAAPAHVHELRQDRLLRLLPNRHASRHAADAAHPIARSAEPGETWSWCFVDEVAFVVDGED